MYKLKQGFPSQWTADPRGDGEIFQRLRDFAYLCCKSCSSTNVWYDE